MSTEKVAVAKQDGLADIAQIEALADQLSVCADELHARIMLDITSRKGAPMSDAEQNLARQLLDEISGHGAGGIVRLPYQLQIRHSTGPVPAGR